MVSEKKSYTENQNTFGVHIFFLENRTVYEMTTWRMRIACWNLRLHKHTQNM
jgi:hypothetical protein